ncbi:MAG: hypothetical protein JW788_06230, partial [Candidatus Omnitrophica bacterium]|nr:hypothetical protein [Candidatus Omnitrophota bacterium]
MDDLTFKNYAQLAFLSLLAGALFYVSAALFFCLIFTVALFFILLRHSPYEDRKYLLNVMLIALFLRLALLIAVQYYCYSKGSYDILGDGQDNIFRGLNLSDYLRGFTENNTITLDGLRNGSYNIHGKTFFNGFFFALFGKDVVSLKYLN